MLSSADWAAMAADLEAVRGDNEVTLALRRGSVTLNGQAARIARMGGARGQTRDSAGGQQAEGQVVVMGETDMDVQPGDRFTVEGVVYEVTFVRPNKRAATVAEARAVE